MEYNIHQKHLNSKVTEETIPLAVSPKGMTTYWCHIL